MRTRLGQSVASTFHRTFTIITKISERFFALGSLAIESLVAIFKFVHNDPSKIPNAAFIAFAAAALLAAWGIFVRMDQREGSRDR